MSKIMYFVIGGSLVLAAAAAVHVSPVDARQSANFIYISVLAENQADYQVDTTALNIPAVSMDIVEDKVHDVGGTSTVPVITYTSPAAKDTRPEEEPVEPVEDIKHWSDPVREDTGVEDQSDDTGKEKDKEKEKDKDKEKTETGEDGKDKEKDKNKQSMKT